MAQGQKTKCINTTNKMRELDTHLPNTQTLKCIQKHKPKQPDETTTRPLTPQTWISPHLETTQTNCGFDDPPHPELPKTINP